MTTSVVVVVGPGDRDHDVGDTLRSVPDGHEVIVVANGVPAPAGAARATRLVELTKAVPYGTAAGHGASLATGREVCLLAPGSTASPAALVAMLSRSGNAFATAPAALCVRRAALVRGGGLDAAAADVDAVATDLAHVVGTTVARADRRAAPATSVLVVARAVPSRSGPYPERRAAQLVADLAAVALDARVTVLAVDGRNSATAGPALDARGVDVAVGPEDWRGWLRRRAMRFSHVVVTDLPAHRLLDAALRETQPQAHRVLALPSLDAEDARAARTPQRLADDAAGLELLLAAGRDQLVRAAESYDAAWCATPHDRAWMGANAPWLRCSVVPTAAGTEASPPFQRRTGYVVLATPGADLVAGHEDAARLAAEVVLPALVARDPAAVLRIVVDEPSPGVQLLAGPNVELVAGGDDRGRWFRRSRVALALYPRGAGAREAIALAVDTATPFVAFPSATAGQGLGRLAELTTVDAADAAGARAAELHGMQRSWDEACAALAELAAGPRSPAAARLRLVRACADAGIAPAAGMPPVEPVGRGPGTATPERPVRPARVPVAGSAWKALPPAPDTPAPPHHGPPSGDWTDVDVNSQYQRWCARYGPTRARLARVSSRLAGLVRRPTISIVMPVFDTDPSWLHDAIASVRAQVYEHWELCIGDDGSTDAGTLDVLHTHLGQDPRIRLTRLPENHGIVGASNAALALATGEFVGLLDHDDELKPHALAEIALALDDRPDLDVLYSDEDKRDPDGGLVDPFFKPDWSPDHLMSRNYVCHFLVVRRALVDKLGGFRPGYDGSQDYDLVLRATEATTAVAHVPEPLYTWRKVEGSTAALADAKPWALDAARRALSDALDRRGLEGEVVDGLHPTTYRVRYAHRGRPKVSIVIPTRDRVGLLRNCIETVLERSTYTNVELIVVDNQSTDPETLGYLAAFPGRVLRYPHRFHYPRMMNLAASEAAGELLVFLNNDTEVDTPSWIEAMAEHAQRPEVGIVGARLLYPDGRPQHEGTIVGYKGGHAGNVDHRGFWGLGDLVRNCSAVTGACLMVRPSVYWELGGLDERLRIAWNDVDLCLRARQAGYEVVYTPYAVLSHVEGGTRGIHAHVDDDDEFESHWVTHTCLDPYYSPNFERLYPFRIRG